MRKPTLTLRTLKGIIACTSEVLAGEMDMYDATEQKEIADADEWARRMREWKVAQIAARRTPRRKA